MSLLLNNLRIQVPADLIVRSGTVATLFDFLSNNQGLTEEYLYSHQPTTAEKLPIYSTSHTPIGYIDNAEAVKERFTILDGPLLLVARKGYAGRLSVLKDARLIIHEDAYAIRPKDEFNAQIDLDWFAGHYSAEFQASRTGMAGIGDFPRERLKRITVIIPRLSFQKQCAKLYVRRADICNRYANLRDRIADKLNTAIQIACT